MRKIATLVAAAFTLATIPTPVVAKRGFGHHGGFEHHSEIHVGFHGGHSFNRGAVHGAHTGVAMGAGYMEYQQPTYVQTPEYFNQYYQAVWYFCPSTGTYYPYVSACPKGWIVIPADR